jgi:hypothetical protein
MGILRRFVFWDFPRASWQYDVMVGLILAFVFLTPRAVFKDQPKAASVVMLPGEGGSGPFLIEPSLLAGVPEGEKMRTRATALVNARYKINKPVTHVEPVYDDEKQLIGYSASIHP